MKILKTLRYLGLLQAVLLALPANAGLDCGDAVPPEKRVGVSTCSATDLQGIIACYSPSKPNWHEYQVPDFELCRTAQNPKCTKELVKDAFLRNVMPCQSPDQKVSNGITLAPHEPMSGCRYCPGHVIIHVHQEGVVAVSIRTDVDHRLHDGVVLRYLKETSPGVFAVYTRGIGNNKYEFIAFANKEGGPHIFKAQNSRMKKYIDECLSGQRQCAGAGSN